MPEHTTTKKKVYLASSVILGIIFSYLIHSALEIWYLNNMLDARLAVTWYQHFGIGSCALPPIVQYGLLVIGAVGGFLVGQYWWRLVYIEHRHWRFRRRTH